MGEVYLVANKSVEREGPQDNLGGLGGATLQSASRGANRRSLVVTLWRHYDLDSNALVPNPLLSDSVAIKGCVINQAWQSKSGSPGSGFTRT